MRDIHQRTPKELIDGRTPDDLEEMGGSSTIQDIAKFEDWPNGFVGNSKGGADVKAISKQEQDGRKKAEVKDIDRNFAEYIRKHMQLIANNDKLKKIWIGEITTNTYPPRYLQNNISRSVLQNPGKSAAFYDKMSANQFLSCYIDQQGDLYKILIDFAEIPGALEAVKEAGHPFSFLQEQFRKLGVSDARIGQGHHLTGHQEVPLEKMFAELSNAK